MRPGAQCERRLPCEQGRARPPPSLSRAASLRAASGPRAPLGCVPCSARLQHAAQQCAVPACNPGAAGRPLSLGERQAGPPGAVSAPYSDGRTETKSPDHALLGTQSTIKQQMTVIKEKSIDWEIFLRNKHLQKFPQNVFH